ncbi:MAG: Hpt domain-containing protein, partial [Geobacteraceae bacterium]|nr:Hpt domain-containing protein [Geobacteraceae bacterium]
VPEADASPATLPGGPDGSLPVFAENELLERLGGRSEMIPRFVGLFCKSALPQLEGLALAVAAEDADGVRRHAHAIKGSAGNIAALRMHHTAEMMEIAAKEGDLAEAPQRLAELQLEYREFEEAIGSL